MQTKNIESGDRALGLNSAVNASASPPQLIATNLEGRGIYAPPGQKPMQAGITRGLVYLQVLKGAQDFEENPPSIGVSYWQTSKDSVSTSPQSLVRDAAGLTADPTAKTQIMALAPEGNYELTQVMAPARNFYRIMAVAKQVDSLKPLRKWGRPIFLLFRASARNEKELKETEKPFRDFLKKLTVGMKPPSPSTAWYDFPVQNVCFQNLDLADLKKLAEGSDTGAMIQLAICSLQSKTPDQKAAVKWLLTAAQKGDVHAQMNLAALLRLVGGAYEGVTASDSEVWAARASAQKDPYAMYNFLAWTFHRSEGPSAQELQQIQDLADRGLWEAQLLLAARRGNAEPVNRWDQYKNNPGKQTMFIPSAERFFPSLNRVEVSNLIKEIQSANACLEASGVAEPEADKASPDEAKSLADCDASNLYYGLGVAKDYVRARKCAFVTDDSRVLTMIYANGDGVTRNLDLALHFACVAADAAPAEVEYRTRHLLEMKATTNPEKFDFCDDITSGMMQAQCAALQGAIQENEHQAEFKKLSVDWPVAQKTALANLKSAAEEFNHLETDWMEATTEWAGTGAAGRYTSQFSQLEKEFQDDLLLVIKDGLPDRASQFEAADASLNKAYREAMRAEGPNSKESTEESELRKNALKKAQLKWIRYREAWVKFGAARFPKISKSTWLTWITEKRTREIEAHQREPVIEDENSSPIDCSGGNIDTSPKVVLGSNQGKLNSPLYPSWKEAGVAGKSSGQLVPGTLVGVEGEPRHPGGDGKTAFTCVRHWFMDKKKDKPRYGWIPSDQLGEMPYDPERVEPNFAKWLNDRSARNWPSNIDGVQDWFHKPSSLRLQVDPSRANNLDVHFIDKVSRKEVLSEQVNLHGRWGGHVSSENNKCSFAIYLLDDFVYLRPKSFSNIEICRNSEGLYSTTKSGQASQ